jgi:hypothetical protein
MGKPTNYGMATEEAQVQDMTSAVKRALEVGGIQGAIIDRDKGTVTPVVSLNPEQLVLLIGQTIEMEKNSLYSVSHSIFKDAARFELKGDGLTIRYRDADASSVALHILKGIYEIYQEARLLYGEDEQDETPHTTH